MRRLQFFLVMMLVFVDSYALGPIDGEVTINWWESNLSNDNLAPGVGERSHFFRAQNWWDNTWGLRGDIHFNGSDVLDFGNASRYNVDLQRRIFSLTDNTFLAAGLGWENLDLAGQSASDGLRLSLDASFGLVGVATLYGHSIWMPKLGSAADFSEVSGLEIEAGVVFNPFPFISVRAGYRRFTLDYNLLGERSNTVSQGLVIGTGIHW